MTTTNGERRFLSVARYCPTMSQENVEIARQACVAAWRRPKPDVDALNSLAQPDHEMFTVQSLVEGGAGYRGVEGFRVADQLGRDVRRGLGSQRRAG